jgi:hypothetical protein
MALAPIAIRRAATPELGHFRGLCTISTPFIIAKRLAAAAAPRRLEMRIAEEIRADVYADEKRGPQAIQRSRNGDAQRSCEKWMIIISGKRAA